MSIKKKSSIWHYDFTCNGKRYRGSTGQRLEKEAKKFVRDEIARLKGETSAAALVLKIKNDLGAKILLDDVFDLFVKIPRRRVPNDKQIQTYNRHWSDFIAFIKAACPELEYLSEVTPKQAKEYIQHIRTKGRWQQTISYKRGRVVITDNQHGNKALSQTTQNQYLGSCQLVCNTILSDYPHVDNPFAGIPKVENRRAAREAFSVEELKLIGEHAKEEYFYPVFLVGISTGLRLGDICNLKWSVIDMQRAWINKLVMRKTKREISLPLLPGLYDYLVKLEESESGYVFPFLQEKYERNPSGISKDIREFLEYIGIETTQEIEGRQQKVSVKGAHSLRHTFAYLAGIHGIPLPIVQSILGHMSPEMTSMYSDHATAEAKQMHLSKLPDYLSLPESEPADASEQIDYIVNQLKKYPGRITGVIEYLGSVQ
jgi:integrase